MKIAYYPGCTLKNKAKDLDRYARLSAEALGYELSEIENWQCCGGYITLEDKAAAQKRATSVADSAAEMGADFMITACPLCLYNVKKNAQNPIEVKYFTEVLAEALGVKED